MNALNAKLDTISQKVSATTALSSLSACNATNEEPLHAEKATT